MRKPRSVSFAVPAVTPPAASVDADAVRAAVEEVVSTLTGSLAISDIKLYRELEDLARFIQAAKSEIAAIRPHDIPTQHIPDATDELDAVVAATAEATGVILDQAEKLERMAATLPAEAAAQVTDSVTRIFEASNFQDITGQRINKVVKTLRFIDEKVHGLLAAFGESAADYVPPVPAAPADPDDDSHLMAGPQLPGNANTQEDIDALLASLF